MSENDLRTPFRLLITKMQRRYFGFVAKKYRRGRFTEDIRFSKRELPDKIQDIYNQYRQEFINILGNRFLSLNDEELRYVFCFVITHHFFSYGTTISSTKFEDLITADALDCSNFGIVSIHLSKLCAQNSTEEPDVHIIGWEGGCIGNHQMVLLKCRSGVSVLLDPSEGIICRTDFDSVASGKRIGIRDILVFSEYEYLEQSRFNVIYALISGSFKPSDILYYFEGINHYLERFGEARFWPTPGAVYWRRIRKISL